MAVRDNLNGNIEAVKRNLSSPYNFKGSTTFAALPASGNAVNDTYYCTDKKCKYTWNGSKWFQSSLDETEYEATLAAMEEEIGAVSSQLSSEIENKCISKSIGIIPKEQTANFIILESLIDGKYYDTNGELQSANNWWYSPFIPVEPNTAYDVGSCAVTTYDRNGNFLNRYGNFWGGGTFTTDETTAFLGICSNQDKETAYLYKQTNNPGIIVKGEKLLSIPQVKELELCLQYQTKNKIVTVGSLGCDYTNICMAIKENQSATTFILSNQTFDVLKAYKEVYGNDYWANYNGYRDNKDVMDRGLNLGIGCELIGGVNTTLLFAPDNSNINITNYFSILSLTDNNRVNGITFDYTPYLRYAIHDDYSTISNSTNIIENCIFLGKNQDGGRPAIGSGMGESGTYIYRNNIFTQESRAIGIHNREGEALGRVIIADNYSIGTCYIFHYGVSTQKSPCIVTNNKFKDILLDWAAKEAYPNENMELFEWNNETVI